MAFLRHFVLLLLLSACLPLSSAVRRTEESDGAAIDDDYVPETEHEHISETEPTAAEPEADTGQPTIPAQCINTSALCLPRPNASGLALRHGWQSSPANATS